MTDEPPTLALSGLDRGAVLRIDAVCGEFSQALKAGSHPDVEAYCARVDEPIRAVLRSELLRLQAAHAVPVFGDYERVEAVGHGGMGVVYKAWNPRLQRFEALKVIAGPATPRDLARFRFEAEAAAGLDHPNIVPIHGVGEADGRPFLALKWVDGQTLADVLPELRRDLRAVAAVLVKVARAVQHAHRRGILHRDLKPGNVLLDADGVPHVLDFGLARRLESQGSQSVSEVAGTAAYMAPEQARGERGPTTGIDVYGLGAILYEALTGRPPFVGRDLFDILRQAQDHSPPRPVVLVPGVDPDLAAVCEKCLARNPADRYRSAEALAIELEHWLAGEGVAARPPGLWDWLGQVVRNAPPAEPGEQGARRRASAWRLLFWLGVWILAADLALFAVVGLGLVAAWAWAAVALRGAVLWAVYRRRLARFRDLGPRDRHTLIVGLAHLACETALYFMYLPLDPFAAATPILGLFAPLQAATGMALFICGSTYWGRLLPVGLALIVTAPALAWWPARSPLLHAALVPPALGWWAYCTRRSAMAELAA